MSLSDKKEERFMRQFFPGYRVRATANAVSAKGEHSKSWRACAMKRLGIALRLKETR